MGNGMAHWGTGVCMSEPYLNQTACFSPIQSVSKAIGMEVAHV